MNTIKNNIPKPIMSALILTAVVFLTTTCEKFETLPVTKLRTDYAHAGILNATVSGRIVDLSGDNNTEYGICFAIHENPTINDFNVANENPQLGEFSIDVENLTHNTLYYVRTFCKDGNSYVYGNTLSFFTTDGSANVATHAVLFVSPVSARISGTVNADGGTPVSERGIVWNTAENPTLEDNYNAVGSGLGSFVANIVGLNPSTTYYLKAYAKNSAGVFYGNELTVNTLDEGTMADIEGNVYQTITINGKTWMSENLRVTKFAGGTDIENVTTANAWQNLTSGAYVWYENNNTGYSQVYGALYNFFAVSSGKLCPTGWRPATKADWEELIILAEAADNQNAGNVLKSCRQINSPTGGNCAVTEHPRWEAHEIQYGTDNLGFAALPGGIRYSDGTFLGLGSMGYFWSATSLSDNNAWYTALNYSSNAATLSVEDKRMAFSVRCVQEW